MSCLKSPEAVKCKVIVLGTQSPYFLKELVSFRLLIAKHRVERRPGALLGAITILRCCSVIDN